MDVNETANANISHDLIKDYKGTGDFTFGTNIPTSFDFIFHMAPNPHDCIITAYRIEPPGPALQELQKNVSTPVLEDFPYRNVLECTLNGITTDGGRIICKKLWITDKRLSNVENKKMLSFTFSPGDEVEITYEVDSSEGNEQHVYLLTNLLFDGNEAAQRGLRDDWAGKSIIEVNGLRLEFVRLLPFKEIYSRFRSETGALTPTLITTEILSRSNEDIEDELDEIIWPLCQLCTLGQHCSVTPQYLAVKVDNSWQRVLYRPYNEYGFNRYEPCIDFGQFRKIEENDFKKYLEQCYNGYTNLREEVNLDLLIYYTTQLGLSRVPRNIQEIHPFYLILCVAFESLAESAKDLQKKLGFEFPLQSQKNKFNTLLRYVERHRCCQPQKGLEKLAQSIIYQEPSLKEKLRAIFIEFEISFDDEDLDLLIEMRNPVLHTGNLPDCVDHSYKEVLRWKDIYDQVLLTIVGYKGGRRIVRSDGFRLISLE